MEDEHGARILLLAETLVELDDAEHALEHMIASAYAYAHLTETTPQAAGETLFKVATPEEWETVKTALDVLTRPPGE